MTTEKKVNTAQTVAKKFKLDKKHLQGFVAGILVGLIVFSSLVAGMYPGFFTGTFTRQIGTRTLAQEVDLQPLDMEPGTINAQRKIEQTFLLDIEPDQIKSLKTEHYYLDGLFYGMEVTAVAYEDEKLAVTISGEVASPHAFGPDRDNPTGDIYIMQEAVVADETAYVASVGIIYPELLPEVDFLNDQAEYEETLRFTLSGDTFAKAPVAGDITLSGAFEGMAVSSISQKADELIFTVSGQKHSAGGNGIVVLSGDTLNSSFSVDRVINIAGASELFSFKSITVEEPFSEKMMIAIKNDFFAEDLSVDMFTLGGMLEDAKISEIAHSDHNSGIWVTMQGAALRQPGVGTIAATGEATVSGRPVEGTIEIVNPEIYAFRVVDGEESTSDNRFIYEVYSLGEDFKAFISAKDFVLKGSLADLEIEEVEWLSGFHVRITTTGDLRSGDGIISVRTAAMGGVTGAEATVQEVKDLGILGASDSSSAEINAEMDGQTGAFGFSALANWGINQAKDMVVSRIKSGLQGQIDKGLSYFLRAIGLQGPPIEEMLEEIKQSIDELKEQNRRMEARVLTAVKQVGLDGRIAQLNSHKTRIDQTYNQYMGIKNRIENYTGEDPYEDAGIKYAIERIAGDGGDLGRANLNEAVINIARPMASGLIQEFYAVAKMNLPFEHNAAEALRTFVAEMIMYQTKGALLYAEYINYNAKDEKEVYFNNKLEAFVESFDQLLDEQENLLPSDSVFNIQNNPLPGYVTVKSNSNNKTYIFVNDVATIESLVARSTYGGHSIPHDSGSENEYSHKYLPTIFERLGYGSSYSYYHWFYDHHPSMSGNRRFVPYTLISKEDQEKLMEYRETHYPHMNPRDFLSRFTSANGLHIDWVLLEEREVFAHWGRANENRTFYILRDGSYRVENAWDLFEHRGHWHAKIILVQR